MPVAKLCGDCHPETEADTPDWRKLWPPQNTPNSPETVVVQPPFFQCYPMFYFL